MRCSHRQRLVQIKLVIPSSPSRVGQGFQGSWRLVRMTWKQRGISDVIKERRATIRDYAVAVRWRRWVTPKKEKELNRYYGSHA